MINLKALFLFPYRLILMIKMRFGCHCQKVIVTYFEFLLDMVEHPMMLLVIGQVRRRGKHGIDGLEFKRLFWFAHRFFDVFRVVQRFGCCLRVKEEIYRVLSFFREIETYSKDCLKT